MIMSNAVIIMPIISMFYGIIIRMYTEIGNIHAEYGEEKAEISFDGEILAGKMRADRLHMVQAWIHIHHDELVADWNIAMTGEKVFRIDPLK